MAVLNNWEAEGVVHRDRILELGFLCDGGYITEVADGYFCLNTPFGDVERRFYEERCRALMAELGIKDVELELKALIRKFNRYNEIKEVAEALCSKIADLRGVSIKDIHNELGILFDE